MSAEPLRRRVEERRGLNVTANRLVLLTAASTIFVGCKGDVSPFNAQDRPTDGGGEVVRLTFSPHDDRAPAWSVSGDSVYYSAEQFGDLVGHPGVLVGLPRAGGGAEPLLETVQFPGAIARWLVNPALAPDGERIAYLEIGPLTEPGLPLCQILEPGLSCDGPLVDTVPRLTSFHLRVREPKAAGPIDEDPTLRVPLAGVSLSSPSLPRIYEVHDYPFQRLFLGERALAFGPSWAPDGERIAFSDGLQLYVWRVGTDSAEAIPGTTDGLAPAWSPNGEWIAFFRVERADSIPGSCTRTAFGDVVCRMDRTIYTLGRRVLQVIRPDGSGLVEVGEGEDPAWSPDGESLFFRRAGQIWRSAPDGANAAPVPLTGDAREPAVSPDGRFLVFSRFSSNGDLDIWVVDLESLR